MKKPLISIVIPVKNNFGTLESTLNTVLRQDYENLQIIVSNNSNQVGVTNLVKMLNDERIKCVSQEKSTSFSNDWEFSLSHADGDFISFLGDDDGIIPGALKFAMQLMEDHGINVITWNKLNYQWPDHLQRDIANSVQGDFTNKLYIFNSRKALDLIGSLSISYNKLPCIYNSIVSRQMIESIKLRSQSKMFFAGVIPDVYSSIALASTINRYLYADIPLTINGASKKSSGVIQGLDVISGAQKERISDVINSGMRYDNKIGAFNSSIGSITIGEYLLAKSDLGLRLKNPNWIMYLMYLIRESRTSKKPEEIIKGAQYTAKKLGIYWLIPWHLLLHRSASSPVQNYGFRGGIKLKEDVIANVELVANFFEYLVPKHVSIYSPSIYELLKELFFDFVKKSIEIYRIAKLK